MSSGVIISFTKFTQFSHFFVKKMYFPDLQKKLSLFMPGHYQSLISSCASERVLSQVTGHALQIWNDLNILCNGLSEQKRWYRAFNLAPRVLSLASTKNPGCGQSRGSQNLGAKNKGGKTYTHKLRKFVLKVTNNNQGTFLGRAPNSSDRMLLLDLLFQTHNLIA